MSESRPAKIRKYISKDLGFRAAATVATEVVREMQSLQNTYPLATMAVGRSMMGAALMASQLKPHQQVSLYFRGDGPMEMFFAEANYEGEVRGYTPNPQLELPFKEGGALDMTAAIGRGILSVVRTLPHQRQPHRGSVEIQSGEVGDDIAFYLQQSHQIPSLVLLGVKVNPYGLVTAAGGLIVELMPGAPEQTIAQLEKRLQEGGSLSEAIDQGATVDDIAQRYLKGLSVTELDHPHDVHYSCRCSKERLSRSLILLGEEELRKMIDNKEPAEARCEFCGRQYRVEVDELKALLGGPQMH